MDQEIKPHPTHAPMLAGFWIRLAADSIDALILYLGAVLIGIVAEPWFISLGENGLWVGLAATLAYYTYFHSYLGKGQSPAKRLLKLQVLDLKGEPLPLTKSFFRYVVVAFIFYNQIFVDLSVSFLPATSQTWTNSILGSLWLITVVGCALMVPLHPLKRGLHDLVAGSIVVRKGTFDAGILKACQNPGNARRAYFFCGGIAILIVAGALWGLKRITSSPGMTDVFPIRDVLEADKHFSNTSVEKNTFTMNSFSGPSTTTTMLVVRAKVSGPLNISRDELKPAYDQVFKVIREEVKNPKEYDKYRVGLWTGYNIGIRQRSKLSFMDEKPAKPGTREESGSQEKW